MHDKTLSQLLCSLLAALILIDIEGDVHGAVAFTELAELGIVQMRAQRTGRVAKGRRHWEGKAAQQQAVYANRRRVRGSYGKSLLKRRGELVERSFAHCYDTGGMRRTHLRKHDNILKRQLIHVGAFNLSLIFRRLLGAGTPREWKNLGARLLIFLLALFTRPRNQHRPCRRPRRGPRTLRLRSSLA
jgi:hypothetical protein